MNEAKDPTGGNIMRHTCQFAMDDKTIKRFLLKTPVFLEFASLAIASPNGRICYHLV